MSHPPIMPLQQDRPIVILSGAGISTAAGLPTFRGAGGLWNGVPVEQVASPAAWKADPAQVRAFYDARRIQLGHVQPTAAHRALARLQDHRPTRIVTQNVDDLHERAGSREVLHLHGELLRLRSLLNPAWTIPIGYEAQDPARRGSEGERLRPDIVWFGEPVPRLRAASELVATASELWIIGTSLQVYPAADLWRHARDSCRLLYVDPNPPQDLPDRFEVHVGMADDVIPPLVEEQIREGS